MPREILVDWTTASGLGKVSVFFQDLEESVSDFRDALATMLGTVDGSLDDTTSWSIRQEGRELTDEEGGLQGVWSDSDAKTGTGAGTGECVPDAAQVLMQWQTSTITGGRFVRGRTFIPGLSTGGMVSGNVSSAIQTAWTTLGNTFIGAGVGAGVWHRPVSGSGGLFCLATSCSIWPELAVLRRRRG